MGGRARQDAIGYGRDVPVDSRRQIAFKQKMTYLRNSVVVDVATGAFARMRFHVVTGAFSIQPPFLK